MTMSDFQKDVQSYFDRHALERERIIHEHAFHRYGYFEKRGEILEIIKAECARRERITLCDVGCNAGTLIEMILLAGVKADCSGVDISEEAIRLARGNDTLRGVTLKVGSGDKLPFDGEAFDVVTVVEVLEHVQDKVQFLREVYRVLRPGGLCLVTTPNKESLALRLQCVVIASLRSLFGRKGDKDIFSSAGEVESMAHETGFEVQNPGVCYWPRPYITISYRDFCFGFIVIPPIPFPLPSGVLLRLQRLLNRVMKRFRRPSGRSRSLYWSLFFVLRRPVERR